MTYHAGKCGDAQDVGCVGGIIVANEGTYLAEILRGNPDGPPQRIRKLDTNFMGGKRCRGLQQAIVTPVHADAAPYPLEAAWNGREMPVDKVDQRRARCTFNVCKNASNLGGSVILPHLGQIMGGDEWTAGVITGLGPHAFRSVDALHRHFAVPSNPAAILDARRRLADDSAQ